VNIGALFMTNRQAAEADELGQRAFDDPSMAAQPFAAVHRPASNARHDRAGPVSALSA